MNIHQEAVKLWLETYKNCLFSKTTMPGGGTSNMVLNPKLIAQKADEVVKEFKVRFIKHPKMKEIK